MNTLLLTELTAPDTNINIILPELVVAFAGVVVMIYDSFFPKDRITSGLISLAGLAVSAFLLINMWGADGLGITSWNGMIAHDNLRLGFSIVFLIVTAMTILVSTVWIEREDVPVGEYNALLAAGVFDFASGLSLVARRGQIMGQVSGGGMAAVIGMEPAAIQDVLNASEAGRRLDVANFNSFDQTVIAGPKDDLATVKPQFESSGVRAYIPLNVSAPFHSRYMRDAQAEFASSLDSVVFNPPQIPVISNVTGKPYDPELMRQTLSEQIGNSVRWLDTIVYLLAQPDPVFEEVGPGTVLTKLVAQIRKRLR